MKRIEKIERGLKRTAGIAGLRTCASPAKKVKFSAFSPAIYTRDFVLKFAKSGGRELVINNNLTEAAFYCLKQQDQITSVRIAHTVNIDQVLRLMTTIRDVSMNQNKQIWDIRRENTDEFRKILDNTQKSVTYKFWHNEHEDLTFDVSHQKRQNKVFFIANKKKLSHEIVRFSKTLTRNIFYHPIDRALVRRDPHWIMCVELNRHVQTVLYNKDRIYIDVLRTSNLNNMV